MKKPRCGGGYLGAPIRALSRACDLYVRGMSGVARHVPSGAAGAVGRGGYGRSASTSSMLILRTSSDRAEDLVRAAARQGRRVAPAEVADAKKSAGLIGAAAPGSKVVPERKTGGAAAMETIAEDAPCEFGACVLPPSSRRRGAAASGLTTRTGGFGTIKAGSEVFGSSHAKPCVRATLVAV